VSTVSGATFSEALELAWRWAADREWRGHDPYDALTSPLLRSMAGRLGRPFGVAATQALRRLPFNLRPLFGIQPTLNAKGVALFLSSASRVGRLRECRALADLLESLASKDYSVPCWGYPFPWQARAFFLPEGTPTVVVTSFAGQALLDAHAATGEPRYLETAIGACRFVREKLHRTSDATGDCLSYSPVDRAAVYNASILGARLLVLAGERSSRPDLIEAARPLVTYVLARQRPDGAWSYGAAGHHGFVDSFHTGFVLACLDTYRRATADAEVDEAVRRGLAFYERRFFGPRGEPHYYEHRAHPYDIHSAAQGVLTFLELRGPGDDLTARARKIGTWMVDRMLDRSGAFGYQIRFTHRVRIPYMRWSQAWGVRALAELVHCGVERERRS
jgi:hypothetical protein